MNITQARRLIWQTKKNIGELLTSIRLASRTPSDTSLAGQETRAMLGANQAQLHELWKKYPEFAPVKVRQMKLNI
ncbi:MAG: hypothetical protein NT096_00265 [Proteobacteria bacterium]|nr:hypothetical protein [Pseudomonadota bacterium]